ncbi:MAG TPA: hypothetical protein VFH03_05765 [Actinoplanes sp.]|nr:hypothetical protein [Actinoplanes sp.]
MADNLLSVRIDVSEPGADGERRDELADRLSASLREAVPGAVAVRPPAGAAPPGSRGTLETVGAVLVTVQASVELFRVVHATVRDWLDRTPRAEADTTIRVERGEIRIEIAGVPPEQQEEMLTGIIGVLGEDDDRD